jgi:hypothetical protein
MRMTLLPYPCKDVSPLRPEGRRNRGRFKGPFNAAGSDQTDYMLE